MSDESRVIKAATNEWALLVWRTAALVLLGVATYFLADVHGEVKSQGKAIWEIRTEMVGRYAPLEIIVSDHKKRIERIEDHIWRKNP